VKRKIFAVLMATLMVCVFALTSCGQQEVPATDTATAEAPAADTPAADTSAADTSAGAPSVTSGDKLLIAYPEAEGGNARYSIMSNTVRHLGGLVGVDFVFEDADYSPEAQVEFFENQIAAGAKGILFWPPADSILPTITKLCEENEVYWAISFRSISDPEVEELVYSSPYYVGRVYEDEFQVGLQMADELNDAGKKKIAIITTPRGDNAGDQREAGLREGCEKYGIEIVAEARDMKQPSDITSASESFLSSHSDLDAIVELACVVADALNPIAKAIIDSGRQDTVQIFAVDFWDGMTDLFEAGVLKVCIGHPHIGYDPYMSAVKLVNQLTGNPISADKIDNELRMYPIRTYEDSKLYEDKFLNPESLYYSDEWVSENLLKANNPNLDADMLQKYIDEWDPLKDY